MSSDNSASEVVNGALEHPLIHSCHSCTVLFEFPTESTTAQDPDCATREEKGPRPTLHERAPMSSPLGNGEARKPEQKTCGGSAVVATKRSV